MRELPFSDLKVLDLSWVVAGPMIGRTLADFGACVVRVESSKRIDTARLMGPFPEGKPDVQRSALYENCNAGKLGLALDLSSEEGRKVAIDLAAWADVLVESFSPGQMNRWGLGYETLSGANPGLIMVSTSLMGQTGPYSSFAGFGNVGAAMAGFQFLVGERDAMPVGPFGPFTDYVGPRFGLVALLAALEHRRVTEEGCWLDVSQAEAGIQLLAPDIANYAETHEVLLPNGNRDVDMAPHGVFRCRAVEAATGDDSWVAIAVRDDADWRALAEVIGGAELASDLAYASLAGRRSHEDHLEQLISEWTASRYPLEIQAQLQAIGVPAHIVSGSRDMLDDPQLVARNHFVKLDRDLEGVSTVENSRYTLSDTPGTPTRAAPFLGRDNAFILRYLLGYDAARMAALEAAGVLV